MERVWRYLFIICFSIFVIICNAAPMLQRSRNKVDEEYYASKTKVKSPTENDEKKPVSHRRGAHFWFSPKSFFGAETSGESGEEVVHHFERMVNDTVETMRAFMLELIVTAGEVNTILTDEKLEKPDNAILAVHAAKTFVNDKWLEAVDYIRGANTSCYKVACSITRCYMAKADWCINSTATITPDIYDPGVLNKSYEQFIEPTQKPFIDLMQMSPKQ